MEIYSIEEKTDYIRELFEGEKYDSFYLHEARIKTNLDYYINGRQNRDYFEDAQKETLSDYIEWKEVKPIIYAFLKGKRSPLSFKLVLMFHRENISLLLEMHHLPVKEEDVSALFMNILYEHDALTVTTGTSLKIFTMDKSLEHIWDDTIQKYYI